MENERDTWRKRRMGYIRKHNNERRIQEIKEDKIEKSYILTLEKGI